ncbi:MULTISPECIES: thioesterase family protein [Roseobacteraceae]|uniref:L-carnitine dehydrogenase n=1 Tax=Pseudosulfitobacter pseudonitzschiae TaxID=1402135 RepID=A0A221K1M1_9RHOB|nr:MULTISPECIES: thioesterase family protein [Roseobacteraceae]ASM72727.1 L-carnitine dehydrogenase [Pseudosulfitobacter pseudonitzschiae]
MTDTKSHSDLLFRSALMSVRADWIDYNGHLNMAYYSVLMDTSVDDLYPQFGFGPDYLKSTGCTTYVAELHICYVRELHAGDQVYSTVHLLDFDEKRFHLYQEIWHEDGWLAATGEGLTLHVDQSGPRVAPMPESIIENLRKMHSAQSALRWPARAGRKIGIPPRKG